jgi:hypothetical protein
LLATDPGKAIDCDDLETIGLSVIASEAKQSGPVETGFFVASLLAMTWLDHEVAYAARNMFSRRQRDGIIPAGCPATE